MFVGERTAAKGEVKFKATGLPKQMFARGGFALSVSLLLACCAQTPSLPKLEFDVNPDIKGELVDYDYITVYSAVARGLSQCWLAEKKPLQKSELISRTNNKLNNKRADIFIHGRAKKPKKGPRIISVHLVAKSKTATEVSVDNRLLDPITVKHFKSDIRHWLKNGDGCPKHKNDHLITPKKNTKKKK